MEEEAARIILSDYEQIVVDYFLDQVYLAELETKEDLETAFLDWFVDCQMN